MRRGSTARHEEYQEENAIQGEDVIRLLHTASARLSSGEEYEGMEEVLDRNVDRFFTLDTPLGGVYVAAGAGGVSYLARAGSEEEFVRDYRERFGRFAVPDEEEGGALARKIQALIEGKRVEVPLDLARRTPFQRRVMEVVRGIPRGEVRPYGWVAREAGAPRAARAVGSVMSSNPVPLIVPCHRVVRNDGSVGSYGFGPEKKAEILESEGVPVLEVARAPYVATPTTGIFCHATCRNARRIESENRLEFRDVSDALDAGFRPCKVCRPAVAA